MNLASCPEDAPEGAVERRVAARLSALRAERGWSLEALADRTGISRATLSRVERCELSPTAAMLGKLCAAYGWTMSRLIAAAESTAPSVIRAAEQVTWEDPETRYRRRAISPPGSGLRAELLEVYLPAGASVSFDSSPVPGLEHLLWVIEGALDLDIEGAQFRLHAGDCLRYILNGSSRFECGRKKHARYIIAIVRP